MARPLYPNGSLAAHVLGFDRGPGKTSGRISMRRSGGQVGDRGEHGRGVERDAGRRQVMRDVDRNELVAMRPLDVARGRDWGWC
jgi:hypothetical protein